ncbi:MAG: glycosyltransferase, partial [Oxalobacteraceae bacterium]
MRNYQFAYADGLNRYYVADEHEDLLSSFGYPPNVFDEFVLADVIEARRQTQQTEATLQQAEARLQQTEATLQQAEAALQQAEAGLQQTEATLQQTKATLQQAEAGLQHCKVEAKQTKAEQQRLAQGLDAIYASTSWRLTAPLRWLGWQRIAVKEQGIKTRLSLALKKSVRVLGRQIFPWLERYPRLLTVMKKTLKVCGMDAYATRFLRSVQAEQARMQSFIAPRMTGQGLGPDAFNPLAYPRHPRAPFFPTHNTEGRHLAPHFYRFVGHIEGHYSLAAVNRGLALAMHTATQGHVTFQPYHGTAYNDPTDMPVREATPLRAMIATQIPTEESGNVVSIVHHYPFISDQHVAKHRFMLFFWEETSIPFETICHINTHFDAVLVASSFVWRALRNSGCRLPIFIIPLGIDHSIDASCQPKIVASQGTDKPFRFLHVSSAFERKGIDILLHAYFARFTKSDPVELYIKTFPNLHNTVRQQLHALTIGRTDAPAVIVDEDNLTTEEMVALYRSAQTLVLPTRGEGFNLSAAEGMALGLPVIVT